MLYLRNTGGTEIIYLNLLDSIGINDLENTQNWSWLMNFTNEFTKESFTVIQIYNQSAFGYPNNSNTVRMPLKVLSTGTANGLLQEIKLKDKGFYSYEIYYQNSTDNLDINNYRVVKLVQTGKALIYDSTSEVEFKEQKDGNPNNFIYVP